MSTAKTILIAALFVLGFSLMAARTQPTPAQERLRIVIEEVQLPVAAYDAFGHLDPTLSIPDMLVLEDGKPQEVRSIRRIPAAVLLLLDTGVEVNKGKNTATTRQVAKNIVGALAENDQASILQFNDKVEVLQDWTSDLSKLSPVLDTKLLSGRRAYLSDALVAAARRFDEMPAGNRHIVLITDGVETAGGKFDRQEALRRLGAANVVVHVISYGVVSRGDLRKAREIFQNRDKSITPDEAVASLPADPAYDDLRRLHKPGGRIVNPDPQRQQRVRDYEDTMAAAEGQLRYLTNETGGRFWLPESVDAMLEQGKSAARLVDAEYVVTYKPTRAVISSPQGEVRRLEVVARRVGLTIVARRSYVAAVQH